MTRFQSYRIMSGLEPSNWELRSRNPLMWTIWGFKVVSNRFQSYYWMLHLSSIHWQHLDPCLVIRWPGRADQSRNSPGPEDELSELHLPWHSKGQDIVDKECAHNGAIMHVSNLLSGIWSVIWRLQLPPENAENFPRTNWASLREWLYGDNLSATLSDARMKCHRNLTMEFSTSTHVIQFES